MDVRIFGKELTNLGKIDINKYSKNHSFVQVERLRQHSMSFKQPSIINQLVNPNLVQPKQSEQKQVINNPQMTPEYFFQIIQYLKSKQKQTYKLTNYIPSHKTVSQHSRAKLLNWLSQLHYKFKMFPQTIFTITSLVDQYLSVKQVPLSELQLVGITALYIAARFQETYQVPQPKQLVTCCANQYTAAQIISKQADMLSVFNFEIIVNSAYKFFQPLCKVIGFQAKNQHLAQYILELALLQPKFLNYPPSLMASAAIYLVKKIRKSQSSWNQTMTSMVGYKEPELKTCARDLCSLLQCAPQLQNCKSIKKKFSLSAFHEVTRIRLQRKQRK